MIDQASAHDPLYRLTYVSRPTARTSEERRAQLDTILQHSRVANQARNLTGALFHSPTWFGQVLEGPLNNLEKTFAHILDDPRHVSARVLDISRVSSRQFGGWAMAEVQDFDPGHFEEIARRIMHEGGLADPSLDDMTGRLLSALSSATHGAAP